MGNLDEKRAVLQQNFDKALVAAVDFELEGSIAHAGGVLRGLSVRYSAVDCLLTLRADMPGGKMVSFVGGQTLGDCFRRAVNEAYQDKLRWKEDVYQKKDS